MERMSWQKCVVANLGKTRGIIFDEIGTKEF